MYAEDIDLSYRIHQSGYANHYFAGTTIIHFKGESTTKDMRYVRLFHKAMIQFLQKHNADASWLHKQFFKTAIWVRAMCTAGSLQLKRQTHKQEAEKQKIFFAGDQSGIEEIKAFFVTRKIRPS